MQQKDKAEKLLEDYNDVFADIINVLLFRGKRIVPPDALQETKVKAQYKADDTILHEMERDIAKIWKDGNVQIAIYGMENQTKPERLMPFRVIGYDGTSYRQQLLKGNTHIIPVVTIILYFGEDHWNYPKNIKELMDIPDELKEYVNDYHIHVFEIAWLTEEQVNMFQSDFRIIADYFVQTRKNKEYIPSNQTIQHVDEFMKLMRVLTNDSGYEKMITTKEIKGGTTMYKALEEAEKRGISQGITQGIAQGVTQGIAQGVAQGITKAVNLLRGVGLSNEEIGDKISKEYNLSPEETQKYLKQ